MLGLVDTTLREGEQTPGVGFGLPEKVAVVHRLLALGIEEIELGVATRRDGALPSLMNAARVLVGDGAASRLALWCRCREEDIRFAASLAPDVLNLSIPSSDLHIREKLRSDRDGVRAMLSSGVRLGRSLGITRISVGLEDGTRAEARFLEELARVAARSGASRVRLADTVGIGTPAGIVERVGRLKKAASIEVGVHTHNDFGMATANALSALEAGADWADVTVLGLGERAGNARLEEVVGYLALGPGPAGGARQYRTEILKNLCAAVAAASGRSISPQHPLVGENIFTCESGLHLQGLYKDPKTYEPYAPERVGSSRRLLVGGKSGRAALAATLGRLGIFLSRESLERALSRVRDLSRRCSRPLDDAELAAIAAEEI